jgi:ribosomal protein S18 acetylase RimI-like enzyme
MKAAEEGLAALGCVKVNLQVRGTNATAVTFYKDAGYDVENIISMGKLL